MKGTRKGGGRGKVPRGQTLWHIENALELSHMELTDGFEKNPSLETGLGLRREREEE